MIYLLIFFSITRIDIEKKEIKKITPQERNAIVINLLRDKEYEKALSITTEPGLSGRIKILKGETFEGLEDMKESAKKGNIQSCNLFLLSNMGVLQSDLKKFIKRELGIDSTSSFSSPYAKFLFYPPESLSVELSAPDSFLLPFIIFRLGFENIQKKPEKAKEYFNQLIREYPESVPTEVARNLIRVIKKKIYPEGSVD
ncbi:MAG: tetratricopeptide repeat protein [candidate division WOR-3 bacterium]|nr:tetratricopeptide repeat protein [candidate division WOR-3 bacterium]